MVLKAERERVKALLTEAITVLCKNGLGYKYTCAIEGLLGITLDDEDVFLVNINETIQKAERPAPVEELAKQETGTASPASSSPSGTPRRRRRHSQEGEAQHSPAKRANYGTGEQEQQQPAAKEDVIVIKEEVSETEFTDFYGDTGGGNNDDGGQYAMQQGDQQYPGAGCSQWDTSQTQGGQSDWPAFNPTQQQQAAISQAASSAMMSPSQMGSVAASSTLPAGSSTPAAVLTHAEVKLVLQASLVEPLLTTLQPFSFRLTWMLQDVMAIRQVWDQMLHLQQQADALVTAVPGVRLCISALTATKTSRRRGEEGIYPGIAYWLLGEPGVCTQREIAAPLAQSALGATNKTILQPYQGSVREVCNALFMVLKDNLNNGYVRRKIDSSVSWQMQAAESTTGQHPLALIHVLDPKLQPRIKNLTTDLSSVNFNVHMVSHI